MAEMSCREDVHEIGENDSAIVFKTDGSFEILIPKVDEMPDGSDVWRGILMAVALGGLLHKSEALQMLIMDEIDRICKNSEEEES